MKLGFDGFMISDHNSYKGCRAWDAIRKKSKKYKNLTVIRGLEYDTRDAGHILVIMPDEVYLPILRIRGMSCKALIKIVHSLGRDLRSGSSFRRIHIERHGIQTDGQIAF